GRRRSPTGWSGVRRPSGWWRRRWRRAGGRERVRCARTRSTRSTRGRAALTRLIILRAGDGQECLAPLLPVVAALAIAIGISGAPVAAQRAAPVPVAAQPTLDAASAAWERGEYTAALNRYLYLLAAPGGDRWLRPIALATGELFETRELTADGRAPRFSPNGTLIAYETGLETSRRTKILKNDAARTEVADLPGVSATFSSTLPLVAYLKIPDHDEIRRASDALDAASLTAQ